MTVGSILPGRLPLSLVAQRHMSLIEQNSQALARLQQQVASGRQYVRPSEAPSSAIQAMLLQKTLERKAQMTENIQTSRSFLAATESALGSVGDALNSAKSLALAGIGDTLTSTEKEGLAVEAASLLQSVINTANTKFRGRYLFGGSHAETAPFELAGNGIVRYAGDTIAIESFADLDLLVASNVDGATAFGAMTEPIGADLNPALTLETRIADLYGGTGVDLGVIQITLESGGSQQTASVDLSGAETIGDIKTRLEAAFASGPLTLAVDIDPATRNGLRLTPSAGTITVSDLPGSTVADDLAIASGPSAQIVGGDLDPRLTLQTELADLRAGSGIDQTGGLQIVNGDRTVTVDVSSAQTIEDLLNAMRTADPDLSVGINAAGNGLSVSSR
ncbi:MAG: flagellar hook-associated protein 3 [Planctomycetes bacterium]|nr:flagellar hook-associated protein 3 [Planctomycetota bacterium]